jgi:putative SOS response-associated peptidase YedK
MCQRYALPDQATVEREFMPSRAWWRFAARYNVSAKQYVPAIRWHDGQSEAVMLRWGLLPSSAERRVGEAALTVGDAPLTIDSNEILTSARFRSAWLEGQRCILPVSGFYAWQLTNRRYRQPHFVHLLNRSVFGIAAIWDRSVTEDDDVIESCTMICVPPNDLIIRVANTDGRMPAILRRRDYHLWLRGTPVAAKATLHAYNKGGMHAYPVSPRINSTAPDDPGLIQAAELVV